MFTLLIADDEKLERDALRFIIQRGTGRIERIIEAANGREAIALVEAERPDMAILDIKMPGTNGVEAARRIKAVHPGCKLLFLTAFDTFEYAREALRIGAEDFLVKPVEDDRVLELLERLGKQLERERSEERLLSRTRETLEEIEALLEQELARQLAAGFVDTARYAEYLTLIGIRAPRVRLGLLKVDLASYPMKIDRPDHADVLLLRAEKICRAKAENRGWSCVCGRRYPGSESRRGEVLTLLARSGDEVGAAGDLRTEILRELKRQVALEAEFSLSAGVEDLSALESLFARQNLEPLARKGDRGESAGRLEEDLLEAIEGARPAGEKRALNLIAAFLDGQERREAGMRTVEEILLVLRHRLKKRNPTIEELPEGPIPRAGLSRPEWEAALRTALSGLSQAVLRAKQKHRHPAVGFVENLLAERFDEDLPVEEIAAMAGQSSSHLSRLFRNETGVSIVDYLTRIRMDEAKRILSVGGESIREVATAVGYKDPNYFARVFRRETGLTPREFRLQCRLE